MIKKTRGGKEKTGYTMNLFLILTHEHLQASLCGSFFSTTFLCMIEFLSFIPTFDIHYMGSALRIG